MGNETSRGKPKAKEEAAAAMDAAMLKCNASLQQLKASASVLKAKHDSYKTKAAEAFATGSKAEALTLMKVADRARADWLTIVKRQETIETQKTMIQQQQLNTMLTGVLLETSQALQKAQMTSAGGKDDLDAVEEETDRMADIFARQQEVISSQQQLTEAVDAERTADDLVASAALDSALPPFTSEADAAALARLETLAKSMGMIGPPVDVAAAAPAKCTAPPPSSRPPAVPPAAAEMIGLPDVMATAPTPPAYAPRKSGVTAKTAIPPTAQGPARINVSAFM